MVKLNWFYKLVIFVFVFIVVALIMNANNPMDIWLKILFFVLWIGISMLIIKIIQGKNIEQPKSKKKK